MPAAAKRTSGSCRQCRCCQRRRPYRGAVKAEQPHRTPQNWRKSTPRNAANDDTEDGDDAPLFAPPAGKSGRKVSLTKCMALYTRSLFYLHILHMQRILYIMHTANDTGILHICIHSYYFFLPTNQSERRVARAAKGPDAAPACPFVPIRDRENTLEL